MSDQEQRRKERWKVIDPVIVRNELLNEEIGVLVNLHDEGFMLLGGTEIRENCLYQLVFEIELEGDSSKVKELKLGAECLWRNESDTGDQHWAGFHILDISEVDRAWINEYVSIQRQ